MAKPLLTKIPVFDAEIGTTIYFSCYGEIDQVYYTVYDNESNEELFHNEVLFESSMVRSFELKNESLTNRNMPYYIKMKARTKSTQKYGELSDPVLFYCHKKPELYFEDLSIEEPNEIGTSSYRFNLIFNYIEDQNEYLNSYQYHLYDSEKRLLDESRIFYNEIENMYTVDGLDAGNTYYIKGTGETVNGYNLDTGFVELVIKYSVEKNNLLLEVKNNYKEGTISVISNIISIDGEADGDISFIEIEEGRKAVDLTNGSSVTYIIPSFITSYKFIDFCLRIIVKYIPARNIVTINTTSEFGTDSIYISLSKRSFTDGSDENEKAYAVLQKTNFCAISNYQNVSDTSEYVELDVLHKDGLYEVCIKNV